MITKFKDYNDLPFSDNVKKELAKRHQHDDNEDIFYSEEDVLIILQIQQKEYEDSSKFSNI
jgi:hypothetical protein